MAVDAAGNSYVTGTSSNANLNIGVNKMVTIKYSPTGEQLWLTIYDQEVATDSWARAIAVDNRGGVYVAGFVYDTLKGYESYLTVRYDALDGSQSWASQYNGHDEGQDHPVAIAVDNSGGVFVTGQSGGEAVGTYDYATLRYEAATGEQTWVSRFEGGRNNLNGATAMAVDKSGSVYVTGRSEANSAVFNYATIRYDAATGKQLWVSLYKIDKYKIIFGDAAIAVDGEGRVYITGTTDVYSNNIPSYTTICYDASDGAQRWVSYYGGEAIYEDGIAAAIAVDKKGSVYVTGVTYNEVTFYDYTTIRYNANTGEQVWVKQYDAGDKPLNWATNIAVDQAGGIYVTGYSSDIYHRDSSVISTIKYSVEGDQLWSVQLEGIDNIPEDMALDASNNIIITGYNYNRDYNSSIGRDFLTVKYRQQPQCEELEQAPITGAFTAAVGNTGSVYTIPAHGATTFDWSITDSEGNPYTDFTGQGTASISVDWPSAPDAFKVSVTYSAGVGCPTTTSVSYVHVFDTGAGFVTGGGWSHSPVSSTHDFMQAAGRTYWGFLAKYSKREGNQVQGTTLLVLDSGAFTFRSTSYEAGSLVITGNRAYFRGRGTVYYRNGAGRFVRDERPFGFLLAATDGQFQAGTGPDKLRLMVWVIEADGTKGAVVYDSQTGCTSTTLDENTAACTTIGGGNIVIHHPGKRSIASWNSAFAGTLPEEPGLVVYPTTVSDLATVRFSMEKAGDVTLGIYDLKGALIRSIAAGAVEAGKPYEYAVSVAGITEGLYLVRLLHADKALTRKLVVKR